MNESEASSADGETDSMEWLAGGNGQLGRWEWLAGGPPHWGVLDMWHAKQLVKSKDSWIAQKYIVDPWLFDGHRVEIRLFVLVRSRSPLPHPPPPGGTPELAKPPARRDPLPPPGTAFGSDPHCSGECSVLWLLWHRFRGAVLIVTRWAKGHECQANRADLCGK